MTDLALPYITHFEDTNTEQCTLTHTQSSKDLQESAVNWRILITTVHFLLHEQL